tara:strand:- start:914 stop:1285 length:372 start_codon:yes stop_codon:yes gene_type:complete
LGQVKYFPEILELYELDLDKTAKLGYNTSMKNNNTTSRGNSMSYYPQTIANKMEKGLTKEIEMYAEISKALREDGNSRNQVSYYMSVDEDFIPDVLQAYNEKVDYVPKEVLGYGDYYESEIDF